MTKYWRLPLGGYRETDGDPPNDLCVPMTKAEWLEATGNPKFLLVDGEPEISYDKVPADAVEVTYEEYLAVAAPQGPSGPILTSLVGNGLSHKTDSAARSVTVQIIAPAEGKVDDRPTINGTPVVGYPIVLTFPGELLIETRADTNDVLIIEEV